MHIRQVAKSIYSKPNTNDNIFAEAIAEKIAIINPYESPARVGFIPSKTANVVTEIQRTFWFLFGVIVGRLFSQCVLRGRLVPHTR